MSGRPITEESAALSDHVVFLRENCGMTFREIGARTGMSDVAAHRRYHRATGAAVYVPWTGYRLKEGLGWGR